MRDMLPKLWKWAVNVLLFILGMKLMSMAMAGQSWAFMAGLIVWGFVYWQYNGRDDIPKQIAFATIPVLVLAGLAAFYMPVYLPVLSFFPFNGDYFLAMAGWTLLIGIPVVGWVFKQFG